MAQNFSGLRRDLFGKNLTVQCKSDTVSLNVQKSATICRNLDVKRNQKVWGSLTVKRNGNFWRDLTVRGDSFLQGDAEICGGLLVKDEATFLGNITFSNDLCISDGNCLLTSNISEKVPDQGIDVAGDLRVDGDIEADVFNGDVVGDVCGNLTTGYIFEKAAGEGVEVDANLRVNENVMVAANVYADTFKGDLVGDVCGNVYTSDIFEKAAGGNVNVHGNLCIDDGYHLFASDICEKVEGEGVTICGNLCASHLQIDSLEMKSGDDLCIQANLTVKGAITGNALCINSANELPSPDDFEGEDEQGWEGCNSVGAIGGGPTGDYLAITSSGCDQLSINNNDARWTGDLSRIQKISFDIELTGVIDVANPITIRVGIEGTDGTIYASRDNDSYTVDAPGGWTNVEINMKQSDFGLVLNSGVPTGASSFMDVLSDIAKFHIFHSNTLDVGAIVPCLGDVLSIEDIEMVTMCIDNIQACFGDISRIKGRLIVDDCTTIDDVLIEDGVVVTNKETASVRANIEAPFSVPDGLDMMTPVPWEFVEFDNNNLFDESTNANIFTVKRDGVYQFNTTVSFETNAADTRCIFLEANIAGNSTIFAGDCRTAATLGNTIINVTGIVSLFENDFVQVLASHVGTAGPLDVHTFPTDYFTVTWLHG